MLRSLLLIVAFCCVAVALPTRSDTDDLWDILRSELDNWQFTENFAVHAADADGTFFLHKHGTMTMDTPIVMASSSKWPSAAMIVGLVADGTISSLDDKPSKYLDWWTTDPGDVRSQITLRHLLSFTSGYSDFPPHSNTTLCSFNKHADFLSCTQQVYQHSFPPHAPGTHFDYNSLHLQFAGAMAVAASNLTINQVIDKYLIGRLNMTNSTCTPDGMTNPQLAVCLTATARDYGKFLESMLTYRLVGEELTKQMEVDYTPTRQIAGDYPTYGHYCMGHFYECFFNPKGLTDLCKADDVHADPGAFGFYPLVDRKNGYYLQIVVMESGKFYPRSGIPEYLRLAAKPYVDAIRRGENPKTETNRELLLALSLDDVNYIVESMNGTETQQQQQQQQQQHVDGELPLFVASRSPRFSP